MFTIYSIGDANFLWEVLNAVAMLTSPLNGSFTKMVMIGSLVGLLAVFFQSILNGAKEINWQHSLLGAIFFLAFIVPKEDVIIQDVYTTEVRNVDNVPLGVGMFGWITSTLGYSITTTFTQAFGYVGSDGLGFAEPLSIINTLRKNGGKAGLFQAMDASISGNTNLALTLQNYIADCTSNAVLTGKLPESELITRKIKEAIQFQSDLYGTRTYINDGDNGIWRTCTDAWNHIDANGLSSLDSNQVEAYLRAQFKMSPSNPKTAFDKINSSLQLVGGSANFSREYLEATVLDVIYKKAMLGVYSSYHDTSSAMAIQQAIQQRNEQWASEATMFNTIVKPMLTYFEGFVYAITPFAAFLLVFGAASLSIIGKYAITMIWIQTWMPILTITNLYILSAANSELSSLSGNLTSIYALDQAYQVTETWLAVGSYLAASTPLITLFLVTGSTYAMSGLAAKMGGGDSYDEKQKSPDISKQAPMVDTKANFTNSSYTGMETDMGKALASSMSISEASTSTLSAAKGDVEKDSKALNSVLSNSWQSASTQQQQYGIAESVGQAMKASGGEAYSSTLGKAKQFMEENGVSSENTDAVVGAIALTATGSVDVSSTASMLSSTKGSKKHGKKHGSEGGGEGASGTLKGALGGGYTATDTSTDKVSNGGSIKNAFMQKFGSDKSSDGRFESSIADGLVKSKGQVSSESFSDTQQEALSDSASRLSESSNTLTRAKAFNQSIGASQEINFSDTAGAYEEDQSKNRSDPNSRSNQAWSKVEGYLKNNDGERDEYQNLYQQYSDPDGVYKMNEDKAKMYAGIQTMLNGNSNGINGSLDGQEAAQQVHNILSGDSNRQTPENVPNGVSLVNGHPGHVDVGNRVPQEGSLQSAYGNRSLGNAISANTSTVEGDIQNGQQQVKSFYTDQVEQTKYDGQGMNAQASKQAISNATSNLLGDESDVSMASNIYDFFNPSDLPGLPSSQNYEDDLVNAGGLFYSHLDESGQKAVMSMMPIKQNDYANSNSFGPGYDTSNESAFEPVGMAMKESAKNAGFKNAELPEQLNNLDSNQRQEFLTIMQAMSYDNMQRAETPLEKEEASQIYDAIGGHLSNIASDAMQNTQLTSSQEEYYMANASNDSTGKDVAKTKMLHDRLELVGRDEPTQLDLDIIDKTTERLENASKAGEQAPAYLNSIQALNIAERNAQVE